MPQALRLSPLTLALCVLFVVHAVAIPLALRAGFQIPRDETIVGHVVRFAYRRQADDSWRPMEAARAYAREQPGADIYQEIFFHRRLKFQYPPSSLLFIGGLSRHALNLVSWVCVWITVALTVALFRGATQTGASTLQRAGTFDLLVGSLVVAVLCLSFYPLIRGYTLGQIQVWVDALFAAALWAWYRGRPTASGICLGIACLIKPPLFVLALWVLVRRQRAMLAGMLVTCCIGVSVSIAVYGFSSHVSYVRVLSFISQRGEAYYPNQSVNGLLNRWLDNGDNLKFQKFEFPPPNAIVSRATIIAAIVLLLMALIIPAWRRRDDPRFDLPLMAATATIMSPIAWEHHYGVWPPILALLVPAVLDRAEARRWVAAALCVAFVLTAQYFSPIQRLADTAWNPLQSYVFFGALLLIATAYVVMVTAHDRVPVTIARPRVP